MRALKACDLFCGAGGTSTGAEQSGAAKVVFAVNHWQTAVDTHQRNFPDAMHINSRLDQVRPGECPDINLLFASPECTHHSRARGGKPTSDQQRAGAWDIMPWIEHHRPSFVVIENVTEWLDWGPVGRDGRPLKKGKGQFFSAWVNAVQAAGYKVDHAKLNAADFGAATSRERLFVIARKGNRYPVFPEPTHGKRVGGELPGMGLQRWRAAAEVIDWTIPCRSVFLRSKPLADKTLARIEAGLRRFVGPWVTELRHNNRPRHPFGEPIGTLTTGRNHGLAVPFSLSSCGGGVARDIGDPTPTFTAHGGTHLAVPFLFGCGGRAGQSPPTGCDVPVPTCTTKADRCVAVPFMMASQSNGAPRNLCNPTPTLTTEGGIHLTIPYLVDTNHGGDRPPRAIHDPLSTATQKRGKAVIVPFMVSYYGNGEALDVRRPLGTVTTKDRCGLVYAIVETCPRIYARTWGEFRLMLTMEQLGVTDIGFRMLSNPELSAAQGFPSDYYFAGSKADVTKQIGNSVSPPVAEAITRALAS